MAGAGYKLFNTGDVLTAAQVNTYLQEQTVMVFASAAARTTALTGVVAEGMISYLTDTDVVQYYNGTTWTTINTDQTPLTTKGDLFTFSTQDARLAVGANDTFLTAASGETTGLKWGGTWTTFTPSRTNITVGNGTEVARYQKIGKTTNVFYQLTLGSTSTIGSTPSIATPTTSAQSTFYAGFTMMQDTGNTSYFGSVLIISGTAYPQAQVASGTYTNAANPTATIPFTWGNTDVLVMQFSYEES